MKARLLAAGIVVAAAGLLAWPAVAAAAPPSLTGETFTATFVESVGLCTSSPPTILWHARGTAAGPYPGAFDETGRFELAPSGTGPLTNVTATFTINSLAGRVIGIKRFTAASSGLGSCLDIGSPLTKLKEAKAANLSYAAAILAGPFYGGGLWSDCGVSPNMFFDNSTSRSPVPQVFGEDFLSDGKVAAPFSAIGDCF
jgi:hypothetical protein